MADTPVRLVGPTQLSAVAGTVYTVPASTATVIREIRCCNTSGAAATLTLSIGADAAATRILPSISIAAGSVWKDIGWIPMAAGEILQAYTSVAGALTITVSGVEIT